MTSFAEPLAEQELDFLDEFLVSGSTPETAMPLSTLDGYLTAIALNPELILPSTWMPWVWDMEAGEEAPEFESHAQAERVLELVMRLYNQVVTAVNAGEPEPLFVGDAEGKVTVVDLWAGGFLAGVSRFAEPWWVQLMQEQPERLAPLLMYGTEDGLDFLEEQPEDLQDAIKRAPDAIMLALNGLCEYLVPLRGQAARERAHTFRRAEPKVGRNDPCPCGSGKKFKSCCGAGPRH